MMRLDRFLSETGHGTRSEAKKLISAGRVSVNGEPVRDPSAKVDENKAAVCIDGAPVRYADYEYYMLYKPKGVISATRDSHGGQTCVTELIHEKIRNDLFPVGRLDKDTEGLLIITNDGEMAHRLLSPKHSVEKTYYAELDGLVTREAAGRIMAGVDIGDEKPTQPCRIDILSDSSCLVTVTEGRYHEIKRMFRTERLKVTGLKRISMGPLALDAGLMPGDYRALTAEETETLKRV